jgi:hypothetical protein
MNPFTLSNCGHDVSQPIPAMDFYSPINSLSIKYDIAARLSVERLVSPRPSISFHWALTQGAVFGLVFSGFTFDYQEDIKQTASGGFRDRRLSLQSDYNPRERCKRLSSRTLWLGAATAAVALFVGGVTMLVLPEDKPRAGVSLMVSSVVAFLFVVTRAAAARRENRLNAIESRFKELKTEISARRIDVEDKRWEIIHGNRLVKIRCESACALAGRAIKEIARFRSSFPDDVLVQFDDISTWFAVLMHLRLSAPSQEERKVSDMPLQNSTFENVAAASVAACAKLRELL